MIISSLILLISINSHSRRPLFEHMTLTHWTKEPSQIHKTMGLPLLLRNAMNPPSTFLTRVFQKCKGCQSRIQMNTALLNDCRCVATRKIIVFEFCLQESLRSLRYGRRPRIQRCLSGVSCILSVLCHDSSVCHSLPLFMCESCQRAKASGARFRMAWCFMIFQASNRRLWSSVVNDIVLPNELKNCQEVAFFFALRHKMHTNQFTSRTGTLKSSRTVCNAIAIVPSWEVHMIHMMLHAHLGWSRRTTCPGFSWQCTHVTVHAARRDSQGSTDESKRIETNRKPVRGDPEGKRRKRVSESRLKHSWSSSTSDRSWATLSNYDEWHKCMQMINDAPYLV